MPIALSQSEYLAANYSRTSANVGNVSIVFDTFITGNGNYSVLMYTPGCIQDDTCEQRGAVNATVYPIIPGTPLINNFNTSSSSMIFQTNNYDKIDTLYLGPFNASSNSFKPAVALAPIPGSGEIVVAQMIRMDR